MNTADCARIREAVRFGMSGPEQERHLFTCADCRSHVRLGQAWKSLPRTAEIERLEPVDEAFVSRVLQSVTAERRRRTRARAALAAAAALLFFFLAGAASQLTATAASGAEDAYAQLTEPASLDSLLPD